MTRRGFFSPPLLLFSVFLEDDTFFSSLLFPLTLSGLLDNDNEQATAEKEEDDDCNRSHF